MRCNSLISCLIALSLCGAAGQLDAASAQDLRGPINGRQSPTSPGNQGTTLSPTEGGQSSPLTPEAGMPGSPVPGSRIQPGPQGEPGAPVQPASKSKPSAPRHGSKSSPAQETRFVPFSGNLDDVTSSTGDATAMPDSGHGMAGLSSAGGNAVMNQDMLLVNPRGKPGTSKPLSAYIGMTLNLEVKPQDIVYKNLHGLEITVTNETNRPLVVDGDNALVKIGERTYKAAPLTTLQLTVMPEHGLGRVGIDMLKIVIPAGVTIGAVPTIEDLYKYAKPPVTRRYGRDQQRRVLESTRFGKRILWPREKTRGIVYFETEDVLDNACMEIPVSALFDLKDSGLLVSSPH